MTHLRILAASVALIVATTGQTPTPSPSPSPVSTSAPATPASPGSSASPAALPTVAPATETSPGAVATPAPAPTPPPITVQPENAAVAVGSTQRLSVGSVLGPIAVTVHDPSVADAIVDQTTQSVFLTGKTPGSTVVTISDARKLTRDVPVRVAFYAGTIAPHVSVSISGDPASADFIRDLVARSVRDAATVRLGGQIVVGTDDVPFRGTLAQDDVAAFDVPVLIQGANYFEVDGSTHVDVQNVAVPRISPSSLMVSDYPERLEENGELFAADLRSEAPSRFLYFHYNPPGQPDRRLVLRADNHSPEPTIVQFISGRGGPSSNEMETGHRCTKTFLLDVVQNQGELITIPANSSLNVVTADLPPGAIVCNVLQLRVLSGASVHLTLLAQNATDDPNVALGSGDLLEGAHKHARGIYAIPEFYYATQWNVTDDFLELPIGQIPLPNHLKGEALSGDYGVLQSFVVTVGNPTSTPQAIAIYENPRGGHATGTYLIDGVLVQSHQVPPFSRYKVRQYVVPARGFVRVTIVTMPEAGSSYPLRLEFAPDDGSVSPGAPGSPIY